MGLITFKCPSRLSDLASSCDLNATQIVERLEALGSEVMQVAQHSSHEHVPVTVSDAPNFARSFSRGHGAQNKCKHGADSLLYELFPAKVRSMCAGSFGLFSWQ
eukprot:1150499-Pelagomonas_calceolata.AAC.2